MSGGGGGFGAAVEDGAGGLSHRGEQPAVTSWRNGWHLLGTYDVPDTAYVLTMD